jgi:hypothetical protein
LYYIQIYIYYIYIPLGTNNTIANILDICNHSLGININKRIVKVNIDIVILKEPDKEGLLLNCILSTTLLFCKTNAGIPKNNFLYK